MTKHAVTLSINSVVKFITATKTHTFIQLLKIESTLIVISFYFTRVKKVGTFF